MTAEIKEFGKQNVMEEIRHVGVDLEVLASFLNQPTSWMDVEQIWLDLGPIGTRRVDLFQPHAHERLDAHLGLPTDHHTDRTIRPPGASPSPSSELDDSATCVSLAMFDNAVTTAKLLLLDADASTRWQVTSSSRPTW